MNILPKQTQLGTLKIVEVYEFYNIPALFLCRNEAGQAYIATWVDEYKDKNVWLYASISESLLSILREGAIDLYEVFTGDRNDAVCLVNVYWDETHSDNVMPIQNGSADPDIAPLPGYRIDLSLLPPVVWEGMDQRRSSASLECDFGLKLTENLESSTTETRNRVSGQPYPEHIKEETRQSSVLQVSSPDLSWLWLPTVTDHKFVLSRRTL